MRNRTGYTDRNIFHSSASSNKRVNPAEYGMSHNQLPSALNFKQHYITVHKQLFIRKRESVMSCIISHSLSESHSADLVRDKSHFTDLRREINWGTLHIFVPKALFRKAWIYTEVFQERQLSNLGVQKLPSNQKTLGTFKRLDYKSSRMFLSFCLMKYVVF